MDSIMEARIKRFLIDRVRCDFYDCGAVVARMRQLARMSGFGLDGRFALAGLGAGPEARVAAGIVQRSLVGGGGTATAEKDITLAVNRWIRTNPPMGA